MLHTPVGYRFLERYHFIAFSVQSYFSLCFAYLKNLIIFLCIITSILLILFSIFLSAVIAEKLIKHNLNHHMIPRQEKKNVII